MPNLKILPADLAARPTFPQPLIFRKLKFHENQVSKRVDDFISQGADFCDFSKNGFQAAPRKIVKDFGVYFRYPKLRFDQSPLVCDSSKLLKAPKRGSKGA